MTTETNEKDDVMNLWAKEIPLSILRVLDELALTHTYPVKGIIRHFLEENFIPKEYHDSEIKRLKNIIEIQWRQINQADKFSETSPSLWKGFKRDNEL